MSILCKKKFVSQGNLSEIKKAIYTSIIDLMINITANKNKSLYIVFLNGQ